MIQRLDGTFSRGACRSTLLYRLDCNAALLLHIPASSLLHADGLRPRQAVIVICKGRVLTVQAGSRAAGELGASLAVGQRLWVDDLDGLGRGQLGSLGQFGFPQQGNRSQGLPHVMGRCGRRGQTWREIKSIERKVQPFKPCSGRQRRSYNELYMWESSAPSRLGRDPIANIYTEPTQQQRYRVQQCGNSETDCCSGTGVRF